MKFTPLLVLAAVGLLGTGCKSRVVFMTQTSLGLDVSGTANYPNKVSLSFDRYEAAIIPRKTNGEAHSVFGGLDADMTFFHGHAIKQTFATGEAAKLATGAPRDGLAGTRKRDKDSLLFFTGTTYGLLLTAGEKQMSPNMLVGYRRTEASVIPIPDPGQEVRSVYADLHINTSEETNAFFVTTNFSALHGVRIKQSFATGKAAEALAAGSPEVRQKLAAAAGIQSVGDFAKQAGVESKTVGRVKALSREQQAALYRWADDTFPNESGRKLARAASAETFIDRFFILLTPPQQQAVLGKIEELEAR